MYIDLVCQGGAGCFTGHRKVLLLELSSKARFDIPVQTIIEHRSVAHQRSSVFFGTSVLGHLLSILALYLTFVNFSGQYTRRKISILFAQSQQLVIDLGISVSMVLLVDVEGIVFAVEKVVLAVLNCLYGL